MVDEKPCTRRIAAVRAKLHEQGLDACYIRDLSNIKWITGFDGVFDDEPAHALIITRDRACLHSDSRYVKALEEAALGSELEISTEPVGHAAFLLTIVSPGVRLVHEDTLILREFRQLEEAVSNADKNIELVCEGGFIEALRQTKDAHEVALMTCAQEITDAAFDYIISFIKPGMTEAQVQRALDTFMFEQGASGLAFPTIVATGDHAASPHAIPGERTIDVGDAVVMDFGARFAGYCSDMTRTIFIGEPSEKMRAAWETIREANEQCEAAIKAGKSGSEIHAQAEAILAERGFAKKMGHGLGHSLGVDIHEDPALSPRNPAPLPAGAVVTVEPGIYLPGEFGMRLEDFGLVTETGFEVITKSTHEMVIIDPLSR